MSCLELSDFQLGYTESPVIQGKKIAVKAGNITVILGPNGAGKTTVIRGLTRSLQPLHGAAELNGIDIWKMNAKVFASKVARVSQDIEITWPYTVYDFIALGRYPYSRGITGSLSPQESKTVDDIIEETELSKISHVKITSLSGGEFQRVLFARALCQEPDYLVLDEPSSHLDLHYRVAIFDTILKQKEKGLGICISMHDLNFVSRIADTVYILDMGSIAAVGTPEEILSKEVIEKVYRTKIKIVKSGEDTIIHPV